ncbi:MAG: PKD domain-containing protein [Thermoplasmatales archaeon]|nr:MAG: PKD domain-containing protein [Thermoplasmatales archaeon]
MKKKVVGILISIALILTILPVSGIIEYDTSFYWTSTNEKDRISLTSTNTKDMLGSLGRSNLPPYQPSNPNPANGSTNVSLKIDLNWTGGDPDGDPVTYDVYFGTNSTPPKVVSNQTNTSYDPGILNENTTYYWQIIAWDNQSASNKSLLWQFTTGINNPPNQPSDPSPVNGSTGVNINVDLSWTGGDPDNDTVTYDVYFGTNSTPPKVVSNQTNTSYDPETLDVETTYYWQIVAWDDIGAFTKGPIWEFITAENSPPYPPTIIAGPIVGGPGVDLTFSAVTSDPEGDEVFYMWDWGDGNYSDWLGPFDVSNPVVTKYLWNSSGDYVIRVKAKDTYGKEGGWSDPHNISISKQIEINNLKPGFIYFHILTFDKSYLYLYAFDVLGITGVISTGKFLLVNATVSESVDLVRFNATQILWNLTANEIDDDMSDGANTLFQLAAGLFELTAFAYDDKGNLIDKDGVNYLLYFCRSASGGGGLVKRALANRLMR